jgi:hypothetical protein
MPQDSMWRKIMKNFCYILETKQRPKSNSNSLANALGKLRFLAKPRKSFSNKLAKSLGKNPRLANSLPTGAYMRASVDLANRGFRPVACSPARANCETFSRCRQMNIDRANIYRDRSVPFLLVCQATRGEGRVSFLDAMETAPLFFVARTIDGASTEGTLDPVSSLIVYAWIRSARSVYAWIPSRSIDGGGV